MKTYDGQPIIQPPMAVMTNQQLTVAAHTHARAIKELQDTYAADMLGRLEHGLAMQAGQLRELVIANRVLKKIVEQLGVGTERYKNYLDQERAAFEAEMKAVQIAQTEQAIKATEKTLGNARGVNLRAALNGQLAAQQAQLAFLKGEKGNGSEHAKDAGRSGNHQKGSGQGGTAPEKVGGAEAGAGVSGATPGNSGGAG